MSDGKSTFAERLLAEYARDNDNRYASDAYARASLDRFRKLSIADLESEKTSLHEANRRALLDKMTWTSKQSLLGFLAIIAYLLALTGIIGGLMSRDASGLVIGVVALGYALWHYHYEKRLTVGSHHRNREIEILNWVLIEKGDEVATRLAGLPFLRSEGVKPLTQTPPLQ